MRNWRSEVRIGVVAGLCAGATMLVASRLTTSAPADANGARGDAVAWTPPLVDPIQAARAALARGDSAFVAVALPDTLVFPGLTAAASAEAGRATLRLYSPASTGLRGARWEAFVPRVTPYAAAYNAVVQLARTGRDARS